MEMGGDRQLCSLRLPRPSPLYPVQEQIPHLISWGSNQHQHLGVPGVEGLHFECLKLLVFLLSFSELWATSYIVQVNFIHLIRQSLIFIKLTEPPLMISDPPSPYFSILVPLQGVIDQCPVPSK